MNEDFSKGFLDFFESETEKVVFNEQTFKALQKEIVNWLTIKQQLDKRLEIRLKELEKYEKKVEGVAEIVSLTGPGLRQIVMNYTQLHKKIKELQDMNDISNHFKNGYRIIERARELFTNQEIVYSIIYSGREKGNKDIIYETNLTMEQLLPYLSITMRDVTLKDNRTMLSNSMRIYLSGSMVAKAAANAIKKDEEDITKILGELKNMSLWNSLVDFQRNKYQGIVYNDSNYRGNLGNLYEVYTDLVRTNRGGTFNFIGHQPGKQNTIGLASSLLDAAISDSIPFYQGGDYGLTQLKAVLGGSTRGLADVGTIERTLEKLNNALKASSKQELAQKIKTIFTPPADRINSEIDKKVREDAIAAIDETIKNANFDIQ